MNQPGMPENGEMRRQRVRKHTQFARDLARRQPLPARSDEQAESGQPMAVRKRGQGFNGGGQLHQQHAAPGAAAGAQHALAVSGMFSSSP